MSTVLDGWTGIAAMFAACVLPTAIWRWAGVVVGARLHEDAELLQWVRSVAAAIIAAFISKTVLFPAGGLAAVPLWARVAAMLLGVICFYAGGRRIFVGVLAGEAALIGAALLLLK